MSIKKIVFGSLLSLSVYGLATGTVDVIAEKCPFDTDKAKKWILLLLFIVSIVVLILDVKRNGL